MDEKIRKMLQTREPVYEKLADVTVLTGSQPMKKLIREISVKCEMFENQYYMKSNSTL